MSTRAFLPNRRTPPPVLPVPEDPRRVRRRARWAKRDLDYELRRLRGLKRFGLAWLCAGALGIALVVVPAGWVWSLREAGPVGGPVLLAEAAGHPRILNRPVPLSQMSPDLVRAVIALHDPLFCTAEADARRLGLERRVAERVFLWGVSSDLHGAMADYMAAWVSLLWSKPRIAEAYLNTLVWGEGLVGAEAAAIGRFGLSAGALDRVHHALPLAAALEVRLEPRERGASPALRHRTAALARHLRELEQRDAFACLAGGARGPL